MPGLSSGGSGLAGTIRAGRAAVELLLSDKGFLAGLSRAQDRFNKFAGTLIKAGVSIGGLGASIAGPFKPALDALGDQAKLADLADVFQLTGERASRLFGIFAASGSDLRDAQEGLATLQQRINDAGKGGEATELFKQLGVSAQEFIGLPIDEAFFKLIAAIKASDSPLGKLGLLMKSVGEDTGKNLSSVLNLTEDQIRSLGDAFETSAGDLNTAREASRAQTLAMAQLKQVYADVATAIAPVLKDIAAGFGQWIKPVTDFIKENRELIGIVFKVGAALTAIGAALIALAPAAGAVGVAFSVLGTIFGAGLGILVGTVKLLYLSISALLSPLGLVAAAVAGLGYLWVTQTESGAKAFEGLKGLVGQFADSVVSAFNYVAGVGTLAWGGIVAAVKKGDLALAGEIALTALELLWVKALTGMTAAWVSFTAPIVERWHQVTDGLGMFFRAWGEVVREVQSTVWEYVSAAFEGIWDVVRNVIGRITRAWESVKDTVTRVGAALAPALAVVVAPFIKLAELIEKAWEGSSKNILDNLVNFAAWVEKVYVKVKASIVNTFNDVARGVLDAAIKAAKALAVINPLGGFLGAAAELKRLKGGLVDVDTTADLDRIKAERDRLLARLKDERDRAAADRAAGRVADAAAADARVKELEARLAALVAAAKAPGAGLPAAAGLAAPGIAAGLNRAAVSAGSMGSYTAAMAAQRYAPDTPVQKQQLRVQEDIRDGVQEQVEKLTEVARGLVLR